MRNWIFGEKIIAYCTSDYRVEIINREDNSINYCSSLQDEHRSITRNINEMGDNIGNTIAIRGTEVYFITQSKQLKKIQVNLETKTCVCDESATREKIADVTSTDKRVFVVSLDGIISNLEHSNITLKLPCLDDEKFTHMKFGGGMLIAISFRTFQSSSYNTYHVVRIKSKTSLSLVGSMTIENPGTLD